MPDILGVGVIGNMQRRVPQMQGGVRDVCRRTRQRRIIGGVGLGCQANDPFAPQPGTRGRGRGDEDVETDMKLMPLDQRRRIDVALRHAATGILRRQGARDGNAAPAEQIIRLDRQDRARIGGVPIHQSGAFLRQAEGFRPEHRIVRPARMKSGERLGKPCLVEKPVPARIGEDNVEMQRHGSDTRGLRREAYQQILNHPLRLVPSPRIAQCISQAAEAGIEGSDTVSRQRDCMPQGGDRRVDHAQSVLATRESIECRRIGREPHGLAQRCQSLARPS